MRDITRIIFHTAARAGTTDLEEIRRWHVDDRGWDDIGYHHYIRKTGELQAGRPVGKAGAHAYGANEDSLGVCFEGHGDIERWTVEQWWTFVAYCNSACVRFGIEIGRIQGHREAVRTDKTCPGNLVDCDLVRQRLKMQLPVAVTL